MKGSLFIASPLVFIASITTSPMVNTITHNKPLFQLKPALSNVRAKNHCHVGSKNNQNMKHQRNVLVCAVPEESENTIPETPVDLLRVNQMMGEDQIDLHWGSINAQYGDRDNNPLYIKGFIVHINKLISNLHVQLSGKDIINMEVYEEILVSLTKGYTQIHKIHRIFLEDFRIYHILSYVGNYMVQKIVERGFPGLLVKTLVLMRHYNPDDQYDRWNLMFELVRVQRPNYGKVFDFGKKFLDSQYPAMRDAQMFKEFMRAYVSAISHWEESRSYNPSLDIDHWIAETLSTAETKGIYLKRCHAPNLRKRLCWFIRTDGKNEEFPVENYGINNRIPQSILNRTHKQSGTKSEPDPKPHKRRKRRRQQQSNKPNNNKKSPN